MMSYVLSATKPEFQRESTAEILFAYNFFGSGFDIATSFTSNPKRHNSIKHRTGSMKDSIKGQLKT